MDESAIRSIEIRLADGRQKYGLTHVDTERSMMEDVLSLAGYSIRRGFLCLSRD
jgi:hypothetical protein